MLRPTTFTVISGGAVGVDLEAEQLARHYGLQVDVVIPPCHPRSNTVEPLIAELLARAKRAQSGAPRVRKFGKLSI